MAYGDFQTFLPSESLYKEPGMALVAAKAEGNKRASYLSSMDQFYAELEEKTRQFDKSYGLEERRVDTGDKYYGLEEDKLSWEKERFERTEELTKWQGREESSRQARTIAAQSDMAEDRLEFERDVFESGEAEREATGEFFQDIYQGKKSNSQSYAGSSLEQEADDAWQNYYNTVMETEY